MPPSPALPSGAAPEQRVPKRLVLALLAVTALGLALRCAHVESLRGDVLFEHPVLDEGVYVAQARTIAAGRARELGTYWQPPGLAHVLAATHRLASPDLVWPRRLQALVSASLSLLVFGLGVRLGAPRAALLAAALVAVHGVLIFEAGQLLPATWIAFFDLLGVHLLVRARDLGDARRAAAAGVAFGVGALFSPLVLVFLPVAAAVLWGAAAGRRRWRLAGALAVAAALPIVPATIHNWRSSGELVLVSSNGGINFYLGNNADYRETFALRPGPRWDELTLEPDRMGITKPGARSAYFYGRAAAFLRAEPGHALGLLGRKLYLYFHGAEIPRDSDLYAARERSALLAALVGPRPWTWPDAVLLPLALVGFVTGVRAGRRHLPLTGFFATQALATSAFFVTSRHRAPLLPFACLLAVGGAQTLAARWRSGAARTRALLAASAAALGILFALPLWETRLSLAGELDLYRSLAHQRLGDLPAAAAACRSALAADDRDPRFWFELGNVEERRGEVSAAIAAWTRAAELDPRDVRPRRRAAEALQKRGDRAGAAQQLAANLAARARPDADYAHEHFALGVFDVEAGRTAAGLARLLEAARLDPGHFRANAGRVAAAWIARGEARDGALWLALGDALREAGDVEGARAAWRYGRGWAVEPSVAAELDRRSALP